MFRTIFKTALLALVSIAAMNCALAADDLRKVVAGKNAQLQQATREYDTATIRNLITDDFTLITSRGRVLNARDLIADVGDKSVKWLNNDTSDVNVRIYNGDCAIVTAVLHERYETNDKISDHQIRFTDTWVKAGGIWRYAAGHASLLSRK